TLAFLGRQRAIFSSSPHPFSDRCRPNFLLSRNSGALGDQAGANDSYRPLASVRTAFPPFPGASTENSPSTTRAMQRDRSPSPAPTFSARSTNCEILPAFPDDPRAIPRPDFEPAYFHRDHSQSRFA